MCLRSLVVYTFTIDLSQNCAMDTIEDNPGIDGSLCFFTDGGILESDLTTVTSVTFIEFDTSLGIINQDSSYFDVSLKSGDTVTFDSISAKLDPAMPLSEQLELIPGASRCFFSQRMGLREVRRSFEIRLLGNTQMLVIVCPLVWEIPLVGSLW